MTTADVETVIEAARARGRDRLAHLLQESSKGISSLVMARYWVSLRARPGDWVIRSAR